MGNFQVSPQSHDKRRHDNHIISGKPSVRIIEELDKTE
jgi:hypothetical protein